MKKRTLTFAARVPGILPALAVCVSLALSAGPGAHRAFAALAEQDSVRTQGAPGAQGKVVDRILAIVDDDAVFQSDVDQGVAQLLLQRGAAGLPAADREALEREVLDELVKNKLVLAKANRLGISVPFSDIEKAVDRAIEENKKALGGETAFARQLEAEGFTLEGLRKLYRAQIQNRMLVDKVVAREIDRSSIDVTDEELRKAYEERKSTIPERPEVVHLSTIIIGFESSENARASAVATADSLRRRIAAGEDFAVLARQHSEDPSAEAGGSLGRIKLSDLGNRAFADAAARLSVGEVSEPVLTPFGYHLIQVVSADTTTGEVELRHILIRLKAGDQDVQKIYEDAQDIHLRLVEGAPFDSMAVRYSNDPASAAAGGDLGWLRVADLPDFFRDVLREMKPGDISPVLREPSGFRIVKLLDREGARPYAFDEVKEELSGLLRQEKLEGMYDTYVEKLRDEFYVEVRPQ
jgi:peptidyl-prolyl cis-trans isomerase SurA